MSYPYFWEKHRMFLERRLDPYVWDELMQDLLFDDDLIEEWTKIYRSDYDYGWEIIGLIPVAGAQYDDDPELVLDLNRDFGWL